VDVIERHTVDVPGGHLALVLHAPDSPAPAPCVIACHGLSSSKESEKLIMLGDEFPKAGIALARFDFRGCGESSGVEEETTIATRLEDVAAVMARLDAHPRLSGAVALLGSSMGGYVSLHVAARTPSVKAVVTWNAPATLHDLANDEDHDGRGIGVPFFVELASHHYDMAPRGVCRHLVVQGEADDVVPVDHGSLLYSWAAEPCDLVIIPGGDHRLTEPTHRRQAVDASREWFQRFLTEAEAR
jgi:pimeloyl-ACP methyl ester carboxylesterase